LGVALFILSTGVMCDVGRAQQKLSHSELVERSRESCVRVLVKSAQKAGAGSGFFIEPNVVVTCCHVITEVSPIDPNTKQFDAALWRPYPMIAVVTAKGEPIPAECISVPTTIDPLPWADDFALLRLKAKPKRSNVVLPLCQSTANLIVGDDVYFSGFPLHAPGMLTHKGMVSGIAQKPDRLCIQASINKGNSGGAVLNVQGEVIGIINSKEGGISQELERIRQQIVDAQKKNKGRLTLFNIDPLESDKEIIDMLDTYISTGIGYARNVSYVRDYLQKHPLPKPVAGTK